LGEWTRARNAVREELRLGQHLDVILREWGYTLFDDDWIAHGRRTYFHNRDRQESFIDLERALSEYGWKLHPTILRRLINDDTGDLLELESGGADTSGVFVHHLNRSGRS
jgi:hypothetical protein